MSKLDERKIILEKKIKKAKEYIVEMLYRAKSGHLGGSLSCVDMVTVIMHSFLNINRDNINDAIRDKFVLSKGHAAPALYANLAIKGVINPKELSTLRFNNSRLQGHPSSQKLEGIDASTGSLGQGLSIAAGMALGLKLENAKNRVCVLTGDGELQEGQIWEAAMFASHYKLDNLTMFIDNNNLQIDGNIESVMSIYPLKEKLEAFGWQVFEINGHSVEDILGVCEIAKGSNCPVAVVAKTVKGNGIPFAENQVKWHGMAPNYKEYLEAMEIISKK